MAAILSQHAGLPPPVANKLAERASAIVWENAPQAAAAAVAKALTAAGYPARLIAQSHVLDIAAPRRVHVLCARGRAPGGAAQVQRPAGAGGLERCAGHFGRRHSWPRQKRVIQTDTHLIHGEVVHDERVQLDLTRNIVVDLVAVPLSDRTAVVHIRLNSHEFNYAQTFGGTIHEGWREKFALLVAKLGLHRAGLDQPDHRSAPGGRDDAAKLLARSILPERGRVCGVQSVAPRAEAGGAQYLGFRFQSSRFEVRHVLTIPEHARQPLAQQINVLRIIVASLALGVARVCRLCDLRQSRQANGSCRQV